MELNGKPGVRYSISSDDAGPYVLPRIYVGAFEDRGFEADGTTPALKLRLNRLPAATRITLYEGRRAYVFDRRAEGRKGR